MWLENNLFLSIHTSTSESSPSSIYHIITRNPPSSFNFQKVTDPVEPFGADKLPHHSILRLRDFPPAISDLLIISSTASTEVGLLSRSKAPLASDKPADSIVNVFTTTELLDDTKRPTLPMTDSMEDSTPVGFVLDLSSKDKVYKPIPSEEELEDSPGPLPGLWILTHEGVLCSWWVVYTDSIKQGSTYPGLAAVAGPVPSSTSSFGSPAAPSPFSKPAGATFGSAAAAAPAAAFGSSSQLGQKSSPWAAAAPQTMQTSGGGSVFGSKNESSSTSFGGSSNTSTFSAQPNPFGATSAPSQPAFGKASGLGFGQSAQLGMKASPWGSTDNVIPSFGQSGFSGLGQSETKNENKSPFWTASDSSKTPGASGFAGFASQGGFASAGSGEKNPFASGGNVFGSGGSAFGSGGSSFGGTAAKSINPFASTTGDSKTSTETAFPPKGQTSTGGLLGSTDFKLQSSFKPDPAAQDNVTPNKDSRGPSMMGDFASTLDDAKDQPLVSTAPEDVAGDMETADESLQEKAPGLLRHHLSQESTTPTTSPAPGRFSSVESPAPESSPFGPPTKMASSTASPFGFSDQPASPPAFGSIISSPQKTPRATEQHAEPETPKIKTEDDDDDAPLPPDTTSRLAYPLGESSSSSAASNGPVRSQTVATASQAESAPLPPDFTRKATPTEAQVDAPLPPDFVSTSKSVEKTEVAEDAPLPPDPTKQPPPPAAPDAALQSGPAGSKASLKPSGSTSSYEFLAPRAPSKETSTIPSIPDSADGESDEEEYDASEGSGIDVARDLSPTGSGLTRTPGFTPQSSFGGALGSTTPATVQADQNRQRPLFGEVSRNAPLFPRPNEQSPRSPSPVRGAVPNRIFRSEATRSVSAPGMASQILGSRQSQSMLGSAVVSKERGGAGEDSFMAQHRKMKARQEEEEAQPLVDEEDDEIQRLLASDVEATLDLDEFIAHSNVAPPAKDSIPSQVEAVYRDINSMIDTLGLNSRAVKSFTKGHLEHAKEGGRTGDDLEIPDDWVLCEIGDLGEVLDYDLYISLEDGRVRDLDDKLDVCQELTRDMHRLRARQEDLSRIIVARMDPNQAELTQTLPLSAEQATQQNELRRDLTSFTKLLGEAEEALTLLKARIASASGSSTKGNTNVPTVDAVMRTITKMTGMAEKRSGDIDVLETQLRKLRIGSASREGSPRATPQSKKSVMFSRESTPVRSLRQSVSSNAFGSPGKATPPRKKLSGFSKEEKGELMEKRNRRQAVLEKLQSGVEKRGVHVWNMEDIE